MACTSRTSIDFPHFAPTNGSRNCERVSRPRRTPVSSGRSCRESMEYEKHSDKSARSGLEKPLFYSIPVHAELENRKEMGWLKDHAKEVGVCAR
jgi:hypothetical protein